MNLQQENINAFISALYTLGLRHAVMCPGSRNAPLILALDRHPGIVVVSAVDERSAGFIALGISKQTGKAAAVCCTSGSAVLNLYPAVSEAWYMQVPMLILTADRPEKMIDRWDGQAIHQQGVFQGHVKAGLSYTASTDTKFKDVAELAYQAMQFGVKGPVHINFPLEEPLYPSDDAVFSFPEIHVNADLHLQKDAIPDISDLSERKVMILNGAGEMDDATVSFLKDIVQRKQAVVLNDIISGGHAVNSFDNWEWLFVQANEEQKRALLPDVLITSGKMILNKNLRKLLREYPPQLHYHVEENGYCADPFFSDPQCVTCKFSDFLEAYLKSDIQGDPSYHARWAELSESQRKSMPDIYSGDWNELQALGICLRHIQNEEAQIHLANSMSIRLAAYLQELLVRAAGIHSNRGVSGIDGCTSTALGMALFNDKKHLLISGELAFFYDINAFMCSDKPDNLKIVVLNNWEGGIFRYIDGPQSMSGSGIYQRTPHTLDCRHLAAHFGLGYYKAESKQELENTFQTFWEADGLSILEIITDSEHNSNIFKQYKKINI